METERWVSVSQERSSVTVTHRTSYNRSHFCIKVIAITIRDVGNLVNGYA